MKHKDGKPFPQGDKSSRLVPMSIMFLVLCGSSFYLGGIFCSEKSWFGTNNVARDVQSPKGSVVTPLQIKHIAFPECSSDYQDYTPCTDPRVLLIYFFVVDVLESWKRLYVVKVHVRDIIQIIKFTSL